jgi:hypothetical protein
MLVYVVSAMAVNVSVTTPVRRSGKYASCPSNWFAWTGSDLHCYYFHNTYPIAYNWYDAERQCVQQGIDDGLVGSHLVSIHSADEENFISTFLGWTSPVVYVGLKQTTGRLFIANNFAKQFKLY